MKTSTFVILCIHTVVMASGGIASAAERVIEEVIVTAQKREQSIQDVPISLSAVSQEAIEIRGMEGFRDWAEYVPGITMFQSQDANRRTGPTATIRGVTHASQGYLYEGTSTATTSFAIGEVPFFSGDPGLYDMNRIEVLRGPQGTLYGISSMGGTVRFIPNYADPSSFSSRVRTMYGSIADGGAQYHVEGMINIPLIQDKLAVRVAGQYRHNDGWIDQYLVGLDDTDPIIVDRGGAADVRNSDVDNTVVDANSNTTQGGRVLVTFSPTDRVEINGLAVWQESDASTQQWTDVNDSRGPGYITRYTLQPAKDDFSVLSLEGSVDLGFGDVDVILGRYSSNNSEALDFTYQTATVFLSGAVPSIDADGPGGLPPDPFPTQITAPFATESEIRTAEMRLQGIDKNLFGSRFRFDYILGVFYQDETRDGAFNLSVPTWNANRGPNTVPILTEGGVVLLQEGGSEYENKSAFADLTFHVTDRLSFGIGARYFDQQRDSAEAHYGDFISGRAANGATVGDSLTDGGNAARVGTVSEDGVTPRFTVSYRASDDNMLYFTASQGKRIAQSFPDPNFLENAFPEDIRVECGELMMELDILDDAENGTVSDSVWSYEVGMKSNWFDRRMVLNAAIYHLEWTDYQLQYQLNQFNPSCNRQVAANAGELESDGIELELGFAITDSLYIDSTLSYTDLAFSEVPDGVTSSLAGVNLKEGDWARSVAPWTASLGVEYSFAIPDFAGLSGQLAYVRGDWRYADERMNNFGDEDLLRQDPSRSKFFAAAYSLLDLRLGVETDDLWSFQLFVSNVFDEEARYACEEGNRNPNVMVCGTNQPRTIGVSLGKGF